MKIELAHDSLASKIYSMATSDDKMLIKVSAFIKSRYTHYKETAVLLNKEDYNYIKPYLNKISIEKDQKKFIKKSYFYFNLNRVLLIAGGVASCLILFFFGIYSYKKYKALETLKFKLHATMIDLEKHQEARRIAEIKAELILQGGSTISDIDLQDTLLMKQLVIKYDTLAQEQLKNEKQRDIARSVTLSELAESSLKDKTSSSKRYAIKLVEKALQLNPQNTQALKALADISGSDLSDFAEQNTEKLIQKAKRIVQIRNSSSLKDNDMAAIFSEKNQVVQQSTSKTSKKSVYSLVEKEKAVQQENSRKDPKKKPLTKPKILETFQVQQQPQSYAEEPLPMAAPGDYALERPDYSQQQQVPMEQKVNNLPCGLVNKLAEKWTRLAITTEKYFVDFKYSSNQVLELKLSSDKKVFRNRTSSSVILYLNSNKIELTPKESFSRDAKIIALTLNATQKEMLGRLKVTSIEVKTIDGETYTLPILAENQIKLKRISECFLTH